MNRFRKTHFQVDFTDTPFLDTSQTAAHANRLNWRSETLLTKNANAIQDCRILDMASHDGRFSYACLKLNAGHVTGVEARGHLVDHANNSLGNAGFDESRYTFVREDVFNYLSTVKPGEFDTILCFGLFYHMMRQIELLTEVTRIRPKYFILDTRIAKELIERRRLSSLLNIRSLRRLRGKIFVELVRSVSKPSGHPCLVFRYEDIEREDASIDPRNLVALPTQSFIKLFLGQSGFHYQQLDWHKNQIRDWTFLGDYRRRNRVSYFVQLY